MSYEDKVLELKYEERILSFFDTYGLSKRIKHILSPRDDNPTVTFEVNNRVELEYLVQTFRADMLDIYIRKNGCVSIEPILPIDCKDVKRLQSPIWICTAPMKYGHDHATFKFCISHGRDHYFTIWIEVPLSEYARNTSPLEGEYYTKEVVDTYETQKAREYKHNHKDIMMLKVLFHNLEHIEFYGGSVYNYATTEDEEHTILKLIMPR